MFSGPLDDNVETVNNAGNNTKNPKDQIDPEVLGAADLD
jgi:hypothetical protein